LSKEEKLKEVVEQLQRLARKQEEIDKKMKKFEAVISEKEKDEEPG
jgi:hypothetical protein